MRNSGPNNSGGGGGQSQGPHPSRCTDKPRLQEIRTVGPRSHELVSGAQSQTPLAPWPCHPTATSGCQPGSWLESQLSPRGKPPMDSDHLARPHHQEGKPPAWDPLRDTSWHPWHQTTQAELSLCWAQNGSVRVPFSWRLTLPVQ